MMALFRPRIIDFSPADHLQLPAATSGYFFQARIHGMYRPGRAVHENRESYVRTHVLQVASEISQAWEVDEAVAAESAINAVLGKPARCPNGFYRDLTAHVAISLSAETLHTFTQLREDRARVERLRFLKESLYVDPVLLIIDFLEHRPEIIQIEDFDLHKFFGFANNVRQAERWWAPIMEAWSELAKKTKSTEAVGEAMRILLEAIQRLDSKLATRRELPTRSDVNDLGGPEGGR
ncbi:hypothetical protein [Microbispora rosea]